jgi:hypothetical protein
MTNYSPLHVSVLGAGSVYGVYIVKWAYQLLRDPKSNRENIPVPPIGSISYSNTDERNQNLVLEVLQDDLHSMPGFENVSVDELKKDVRGYTRWQDMVQTEKPDLVVVCSPTETHVAIVRELVTDFGVKNILCESPVTTLHEFDCLPGLKALINEQKVIFGTNLQYASLTGMLKDVPIHPTDEKDPLIFSELVGNLTSAEVTFITHGTRPWRRFGTIGEANILEDLGVHALYLLPPGIRHRPVTVKNVKREGDNLFLNFIEYDLLFGEFPVRLVLGYRRKLKSLKMVFRREMQNYEFHILGATNPHTGEFSRRIEGRNYAYPFHHTLRTDLVKYSFMRSLAKHPIATLDEAIQSQTTLRQIYEGSST